MTSPVPTHHMSPCPPAYHAFCAAMLPRVSRTFALSIEALPPSLRDAVRVAYLLCRIIDTVEDEPCIEPDTRQRLFSLFNIVLNDPFFDPTCGDPNTPLSRFETTWRTISSGDDSADAELTRGLRVVMTVFHTLSPEQREAIRPSVLEMSQGMAEYAARSDADGGRLRLHDLEDLERYCYFVAGTVGHLLTALFDQAVSQHTTISADARTTIEETAVSFGLGLQLVNIVKDVIPDARRGACFLPEALATEHDVDLDHLLDDDQREAAREIVNVLCARARHHLERAQAYTLAWPLPSGADVQLFCAVPLTLALATLSEVEQGADTLHPERVPKISRQLVATILMGVRSAIDNKGLQGFFELYS